MTPPARPTPARVRRASLITAVLAAAILPLGIAPASADAPPRVTGQVLDEAGRPAVGVLVSAITAEEMWASPAGLDDDERQVVTGLDGRFELSAPSRGSYLVRACPMGDIDGHAYCLAPEENPDHLRAYRSLTTQTTSWVAQPDLIPASGATRDVGTISLRKPSRIRGTLTHANVDPTKPWLPSELVVLRRMDGTQVGYRLLQDETFDFTGLAPGQYRVESHMNQLSPTRFESDVINLGPSQTRHVDATLDEPATLTGRMTTSGRGVRRQQFAVFEGKREVVGGSTDEAGRFAVRVPRAGTYVVRTVADETAFLPAKSSAVTVRAGATSRTDLSLIRGASVTVRISNATGTGVRDRLRDSTGRTVRAFGSDGSTVTYAGLPNGQYTLTAVSGTRYAHQPIRIRTHRTYDLGRKKLTHPTVTLSGTTLPDAAIEISDRRDVGDERFGSALPETPVADTDGRYRITGLVPGHYTALLRSPAGSTAAPRTVTNLSVRRDLRKDLPMPDGASVVGRLVRDSDGSPLEIPLAVEAVHTGENRRHQFGFGITDPVGRFAVRGLMPGRVDVTTNVHEAAQHDYWEVGSPYFFTHDEVRPTLDEGRTTDVGDIRLRVGGGVTG